MKNAFAFAGNLALTWALLQPALYGGGVCRFGVIGDSGTGERPQYEVAERLTRMHQANPFGTVVMLGDNIYGSDKPNDMIKKFALPYKALLDSGVKFYATLGNHDSPKQVAYPPFNMQGQRYYTFKPCEDVRFFALDSNNMDPQQLAWLEEELSKPGNEWKIAFFHHPLYSSAARHGSDLELRKQLEPLFVKHRVAVALSGHDHVYERMKPQHGVEYFVIGNSAKLREGNVLPSSITAKAYDRGEGCAVMTVEGDVLTFQVVSRTGETVDSGSFPRPAERDSTRAEPVAK